MKILKILSFLLILAALSCTPEKTYKYTIHVGSAALSLGYETDTFTIKNNLIKYHDKNNNIKIHPMSRVITISEN